MAFVVYAFAFAKTDVSLEEIQSETRQEQLFRILRALARPDLVTYDKDDLVVTADVYVPCNGSEPAPATPAANGATITVTPTCAEPGDLFTVDGSGYEPGARVTVNFVPISEYAIVLPQGRAHGGGRRHVLTLVRSPRSDERRSPAGRGDNTDQRRRLAESSHASGPTRTRTASRTPRTCPRPTTRSRSTTSLLPEFDIRDPGGVSLVDDNNNVIDFISWGGSFEASTGSGTGLVSRDIDFDPFDVGPDDSIQLTGVGTAADDFEWIGTGGRSFDAIKRRSDRGQRGLTAGTLLQRESLSTKNDVSKSLGVTGSERGRCLDDLLRRNGRHAIQDRPRRRTRPTYPRGSRTTP